MTRRLKAEAGRAMMETRRRVLKGDLPSERDSATRGEMSPRDQPLAATGRDYAEAIAELMCAAEFNGFDPAEVEGRAIDIFASEGRS
jgi:hypothetical protein